MTADIIQLYPAQNTAHRPYYELYWSDRHGNPLCISSYDLPRIKRQMDSLAARQIKAVLHRDKFPCGYVTPAADPTRKTTIVIDGGA